MLIIAGLASFALIGHQVLIPAIMHGNLMIEATTPMLRGFTTFVNRVLGGLINAKNIDGWWFLANGVRLNNSYAATSLLKGLAISGIGSATLVAPVIVAIKKLVTKMNLKQKFAEEYEKGKKKIKDISSEYKKNSSRKQAKKKTKKYFEELLEKYYSSNMTLDEFCDEYQITDSEKVLLEILDQEYKKNTESNISKKTSRKKGS